jgi:hypothetical protein
MKLKKESPIAEEVISVVAITGVVIEAVVRAEAVIAVAAVAAMAEAAITVVAETADPDIKKPVIFLILMHVCKQRLMIAYGVIDLSFVP